MGSPAKSLYRNIYSGTSSSQIMYPENKTVVADGRHSGILKVIHGVSSGSDGFTPTELYRERTKCYSSSNTFRTRASWIDYAAGKYVYYWNTGQNNALSIDSAYSRTYIKNGFAPYYNSATKRSLVGYDAKSVANLNNDVLKKLGKASLDIGVILVEMKDTVNWISKRSTQLGNGLLAASRGDLPKMGRVLGFNPKKLKNWNVFQKGGKNAAANALSSVILETNFAIKPLISDIEAGIELFRDPKSGIFKGRVRATDNKTVSKETYWRYRRRNFAEQMEDNHRMVINYRIRDPDLIARKALGLATNPATAWEAVPYSWLVDYVFSVGDFLAATVATQGLVFLNGTTSRKIVVDTKVTKRSDTVSTDSWTLSTCKYKFECYKRSVMQQFPNPSLAFVLDDLTITKALNVAAISQKLRR
jgi:hypothetical protein